MASSEPQMDWCCPVLSRKMSVAKFCSVQAQNFYRLVKADDYRQRQGHQGCISLSPNICRMSHWVPCGCPHTLLISVLRSYYCWKLITGHLPHLLTDSITTDFDVLSSALGLLQLYFPILVLEGLNPLGSVSA